MQGLLIVTGGLGFIGKNFCNCIAKNYDEYAIIDKLTYASDLDFYEEKLRSIGWKLIISDISEINQIEYISRFEQVDIINFAAESHVDNSFRLSDKFLVTNANSTLRLLNFIACSKQNIRLLHISTDEVYGEVTEVKADENTRLNPTNPYAASKAAGDLLAQTYRNCFKLNLKILRANNIFGPRQLEEKLIPKAISFAGEKKIFTIHGKKKIRRHFIHTSDLTKAIEQIFAMWELDESYIYNLAGNESFEISEIVRKIYEWNGLNPIQYMEIGIDRPFNDEAYLIDDTRIRNLGWQPTASFWEELKNLNAESSFLKARLVNRE